MNSMSVEERLTKSFTAMCIFQLHERGKLSIDDAIGQYIPDYPHGERITLYHCLTNSSGLPNYTSFPGFWPHTMRLPATLDQVIDSFSGLDLEFEPGSRFGYSNSGYAMLTAIIENVSAQEAAIIVLSNMNVVPVTQFSRELAKILFGEPVLLPIPAVPVAFTEVESVAGKYAIEKEPFHVLDISVKQGELYLTVPKMYGVSYKFKLIPVH